MTDKDDTAPAVTAGQTFNYAENRAVGAQVGTVAATDAVGVTAFRFSANNSTTSADGYYQIDATGKITLTAAGAAAGVATNDFETTPNQFIYGIQAGDAAGNWSAATNVTLNVTDLDDTAPVVAAGQTFSYAENQAAGAQVGAVSATDAGGVTAFRFSANNSTTSADGYFQIDATGKITLTAAGAAAGAATNDFETAPNQFTYGIQAGDAQGLWSAVTNVTLKVTDVNEDSVAFNGATPVDGVPTYTYQYKEKSAEGATLGTVSATGAITSPTFTIVGGNTDGWYQINSSTGAISLTAAGVTSLANDFSRLANTRTLQVQATSGTATATVNVVLIETDATGPVISGPAGTNLASEITVDENQIAVLTLGADEIAEWTIVGGDDQLLFNIDPTTGAITFKSAPDYERPADANGDNVYTFQVQAKDAAGNVTVQTITVRVLDLNAAFTGTNATNGGTASYAFDYNEKSAAGTTLGTVGATGPGTEVYTIESGNDNGWFAINSSTGVITLTEAGAASVANDYLKADNLHTLQVKVTSGPESAVIAVALNELDNAGPLITGPTGGEGAPESAVTVDENQVNVWTLTANEPVTEWKIIGSDDDAAFTIDANGKITFLAPPNYEKPTDKDGNNTYILTVQAKDAAGNVSTQKVTVTIRDLNDAPVFTNTVKDANGNAIYSFDYKERTAKDVELNRVSATGSGPLTFAITGGNDNGWYAINSSTGVITLTAAGAASLANDWETLANSQTLTVTAANTFGDTTAIKVLLNELDIDDTAPLITGPSGGPGAAASAITINEGLTAVTKMTANEPIKTWEISGGPDASKLTIAADGTITFKEAPDFENPTDADKNNTYVIIIRAVDMFGNESFQTLTITIGNVDEIAQKLREIGGKLRSDLRNYAFKSMQDMLSFNEGLMQGSSDDDADCSAAARQKAMSGSVNANQDQQALTLNYAKQLNACGSRIRVLLDMGLASSRMEGNTTLRTLASIRAERNIAENVTVGLGVMGSFASDRLNSFADSHISDESFQLNGYIRSRLSEALRVAAFASVGQAKYKFRLNDDGFAMTGRMTGDRLAYGMMLTGDFALAGMTVTTDVALSRASESLGNAKLAARYKGESRSGIAFGVGSVDATRLSVPVHFPLLGRKTSNSKTEGTQLSFSPGLLCEDTSADTSRLICGYQLGGRYRQTLSANDRLTFDVKHEKVEGNQRNLFALGFSHLFGPLELGVALNQEMSRYAADTRALLTVRVTGR